MRLKKDSTAQQLRAAYYTPARLADAIIGFLACENMGSVLEPSCGDGVFLKSLTQQGLAERIVSLTAVEIDSAEAEKVRMAYQDNPRFHVCHEDFFKFYDRMLGKEQYDFIFGNPPYIRYQYLTEEQREMQSAILASHGMKANKRVNTWVAFLVACVQLLSDAGKIAFVVPAEILQVSYAEDLRLFLSKRLDRITLITFEQLVFPDIEQDIIVFIGEKAVEEKGIRIIEAKNLDDFSALDLKRTEFQQIPQAKEKWTKYFVTVAEMNLIQRIRTDSRFAKFSEYALSHVGITTGNNSYFSITEDVCKQYELENVTLPLIGRGSHAHGITFTEEDWTENKRAGKRARLIAFPESIPCRDYPLKHREYIRLGESNGENAGYKCSIRDRWYVVPSVWVPDAFFLRRNHFYPKLVLNKCNAVSTDTMHRIRFFVGVEPENVLLSYYNSISFAFTELCGRSYGGGVLEILPGEMGTIMLPKVTDIDSHFRTDLIKRVDEIVRRDGEHIELALDIVDRELLVGLLGIDADWCARCRVIWKKMQRRRLGRK